MERIYENSRKWAVMMMLMMAMISVRGDPITTTPENGKISLRGVTVVHMPFAIFDDSVPYASGNSSKPLVAPPLKGFIVDLMNELAAKGNFDYTLSLSPDGKYGVIIENGTKINGMLGEVVNENVDFAVADITVTENRKRFVDFTEPIMSTQLIAIVLRTNESENWMTIEDLLKPRDGDDQKNITFGMLSGGSTNALFRDSSDPLARAIYARMQASPADSMMRSNVEGIARAAANSNFAMIMESSSGDYVLARRCNLKKITAGLDQLGERHHAIALRRGSPHLQRLNDAIRAASKDGTIERLRAKWWSNSCAMKGEVTVIEK